MRLTTVWVEQIGTVVSAVLVGCTIDAVGRVRRRRQVMTVIRRTRHVLRIGIARTVGVIGIGWLLGPATVRRWARAVIVQVTNRDGRRHRSARRISRTRAGRLLLAVQDQARALGGRQDVVHGHDAMWSRAS